MFRKARNQIACTRASTTWTIDPICQDIWSIVRGQEDAEQKGDDQKDPEQKEAGDSGSGSQAERNIWGFNCPS